MVEIKSVQQKKTPVLCSQPKKDLTKRNWVLATNSYFLIIFNLCIFEIDCANLWYFKPDFYKPDIIHSVKYLRYTTLGCKDTGIRTWEFVAKTQFLKYGIMNEIDKCINDSVAVLYFKISCFLISKQQQKLLNIIF